MKAVFADTLYWVAVTRPGDPWAEPARQAKADLGAVRLVTTDEVLTEFLNALADGGAHLRRQAIKMVRAIQANANITVIAQSRDSFTRAMALYEQRPDKNYSLTDCISMNAMRAEHLSAVLTNDHGFEQEGFNVLIEKP
jgi:uncharacterized protein